MLNSHNILQRYYYIDPNDWKHITVCFTDRGAPNDKSWVSGDQIPSLESYYFAIKVNDEEKCIPYHRILLIKFYDDILFQNIKYKEDCQCQI
jgi:uncharacterized protein (UPF0248 family)